MNVCSEHTDKVNFFLAMRLWHLWITPWKYQPKERQSGDVNIVANVLRAVSGLFVCFQLF